jgi:hypothetical protein
LPLPEQEVAKMRRIIILLLIVACIGVVVLLCRSDRPEPAQKVTKYAGRTFDQVVSDLGQPARTDSFKLGQALDEMRGPLQNTFPLDKPGNKDIEIKEATWEDGDYYLTVWFHKVDDAWVVIEGVRWHKNVRF